MSTAHRPQRDPAATREALLDAAERLFARDGLAAVPNRALLREAGQRNESALQYHFGGRDGLVHALHARRMGQLEARRRDRLGRALAGDGPIEVRALARVQLDTLFELAREDAGFVDYLKLVGDLLFTTNEALGALLDRFDISGDAGVRCRVQAGLPQVAPATLTRRLDLGRRFILMSLSRWARLHGDFAGRDAERLRDDLLDMVTAMLTTGES